LLGVLRQATANETGYATETGQAVGIFTFAVVEVTDAMVATTYQPPSCLNETYGKRVDATA